MRGLQRAQLAVGPADEPEEEVVAAVVAAQLQRWRARDFLASAGRHAGHHEQLRGPVDPRMRPEHAAVAGVAILEVEDRRRLQVAVLEHLHAETPAAAARSPNPAIRSTTRAVGAMRSESTRVTRT